MASKYQYGKIKPLLDNNSFLLRYFIFLSVTKRTLGCASGVSASFFGSEYTQGNHQPRKGQLESTH